MDNIFLINTEKDLGIMFYAAEPSQLVTFATAATPRSIFKDHVII